MRHFLALYLVSLVSLGCVTAGDLRMVEASLQELHEKVQDETVGPEEFSEAIQKTKGEIEQVAKNVEQRGETFVEALTDPDGGGVALVVSGLMAAALNYHRDRRREARGEPVGKGAARK